MTEARIMPNPKETALNAPEINAPADIECDYCLRFHGGGMIDAHIQDGDLLYIRAQPTVEDGEIAIVETCDGLRIGRLYKDGSGLTLQPCSSQYRPLRFSAQEGEGVRILGKLAGFTHKV